MLFRYEINKTGVMCLLDNKKSRNLSGHNSRVKSSREHLPDPPETCLPRSTVYKKIGCVFIHLVLETLEKNPSDFRHLL